MTQLTGTTQPVELGGGYSIRAPGVKGSAELKVARDANTRSRGRIAEDGTAELDAALAASNTTEVRQVEISMKPAPAAAGGGTLRSTDGRQEVLELAVPDLGPDTGQLVLACDESGVLTWHLPLTSDGTGEPAATRGGGAVKRFQIPATPIEVSPADGSTSRSIVGAVGRKLLKVLVYPVTDPVVGAIGDFFAERWETRKRPYMLRDFSPQNFRDPSVGSLAGDDWTRLGQGRALLFIHGTFSTAHGAFAGIPDATFADLHAHYGGRVFAFNHFTLSHDPERNVRWLLSETPDVPLDVDIVCHSRGGLVARTLAEHPAVMGLKDSNIRVGKIVFVGVPNAGTPLANPSHMMTMIDRLTTVLNLFPTGPVTETLEAIITAVKVIGHGALKGLDGLASMQPGGAFLSRLNAGNSSGAGYYAISADYEPVHAGLRSLVRGNIANALFDRVFDKVANDLVVPEPGVYGVDGNAAFPIADERLLRVPSSDGIIHTTLFSYPQTSARMLQWLKAT